MRHLRLPETTSTNDEARASFDRGDPFPVLISTERQTGGRGRSGRTWSHQKENFAGSFLIAATRALAAAPGAASLLAGLAIRDALIAHGATPEALALKWPNDVLYTDKKVAGVLAEFIENDERRALIIGVGVNLMVPPEEALFPATAVFHPGEAPSPEAFADPLSDALVRWTGLAEERGAGTVFEAWRQFAWRLGKPISVRQDSGPPLRGIFHDIDDHGQMILGMPDGTRRTISTGDAGSP